MTPPRRARTVAVVLLCGLTLPAPSQSSQITWRELEVGLEFATINAPMRSAIGDSKIDVLRIDPARFRFELLCAGERGHYKRSVKTWAADFELIAAVNASMFITDEKQLTSTGFMQNYRYINNDKLNPAFNAIFAFNPVDTTKTEAHIVDLTCQDWQLERKRYNTFSQSLRMLDCSGQNTWQWSQKQWSMVVLGEDRTSRILFIFVRSPYHVADYVNMLRGLPLDLKSLMYLEGGPEASLYVHHPALNLERFGSYETGFNEHDDNDRFWEIPNVIGIKRRK